VNKRRFGARDRGIGFIRINLAIKRGVEKWQTIYVLESGLMIKSQ
jgi:hypothetical protein